nr:SdpI family protein [Ardenticatena sp.]
MDTNTVLLAASVFLGALFVGLALPLVQKRVAPNHWYSLRIPATFADETVWYEANAQMGKDLLWLAVSIILVGGLIYAIDMAVWFEVLAWCVVVIGGVIGMVVRNWRFANRLLASSKSDDS